MAEAATQPLWTDWLLWHVNTGKKKSKTMRRAIREHERKWIAVASAPRRLLQQRTSERELMPWFMKFVITDAQRYKFPDRGNGDNEVTNCTVSSQHFGVRTQCWERSRAPALWLISGRHHSPNITLMQMSVWLWACLRLVRAETLRERERGEGDRSTSPINTAQIIIIIINHTATIIIIVM